MLEISERTDEIGMKAKNFSMKMTIGTAALGIIMTIIGAYVVPAIPVLIISGIMCLIGIINLKFTISNLWTPVCSIKYRYWDIANCIMTYIYIAIMSYYLFFQEVI